MRRLFVALPLPETIRDRLGMLCGGLPNTTWVHPENMHLTLRFIGEVDEGMAADVDSGLLGIKGRAFSWSLDGTGQFGQGRKARQLYLRVPANEALELLQSKVETAVTRAGLPPEQRRFTPHVTLARLKGTPVDRLADFHAGNALFQVGPIEADRFVMYSSHLTRDGPIYTEEAEYPLAPSP